MSTYGVNFKFNMIGGNIGKMFASIDRLNSKARVGFVKTDKAILKNDKSVSRLTGGVDRLGRKINALPNIAGRGLSRLKSQFGGIGTVISLAGAGMGIKSVTNTLAEMEKYEAVLGNTLGSASDARRSLMDITRFASKTPFQVNELTNSFVKLANQGFVPTMGEMRLLGDLASSTGKDMVQLSEAVLDAQVSEFERLKEFGIRAEKHGDKIRFTFKNVTTEVNNNSKAIQGYLLSLGKMKGVSGAMDKISKTSGGLISNLGDRWMMFKWQLGEANKWLIELGIKGLNKGVGYLQKFAKWTEVNRSTIQSYVYGGLEIVTRVAKVAWGVASGFFSVIRLSVGWIQDNQDTLKSWAGWLSKVAFWWGVLKVGTLAYGGVMSVIGGVTTMLTLLRNGTALATVAQWALNVAMTANPIGIIITAVGVVIPLLAVLASKFDWVRDRLWSLAKFLFDYSPIGIIINQLRKVFPAFDKVFTKTIGWLKEQFNGFFSWISDLIDRYVPKSLKVAFGLEGDKTKDKDEDKGKNDKKGSVTEDLMYARPKSGKPQSSGSSVSDRIAAVSAKGGGSVKHITINIENLVREMNNITQNVTESNTKMKEMIIKTLISATNDVNYG